MHPKSNGSLRRSGLLRGAGLAAVILANLSAFVVGCPGPAPSEGVGGSGGHGSSSSSTASSTSSSSTTSSTSTGSGCAPSEECVPPVPGGWQGPYLVYEGSGDLACPMGTTEAIEGGKDPSGALTGCAQCHCEAATGVTCGAAVASLFTDQACGGTSCASVSLTSSCQPLKAGNSAACGTQTGLYLSVSAPAMGGACQPTMQMDAFPPPQWTTNVLACGAMGTAPSCDGGGVCAPQPESGGKLCIAQTGDAACPSSGPYSVKEVIGKGFDDTRVCSKCTCGAPDVTCSGAAVASADPSCASPTNIPVPDPCSPITTPVSVAYNVMLTNPLVGSGKCTPSGGVASGSVTAASFVTLCCM